jgi:hypothetical protein
MRSIGDGGKADQEAMIKGRRFVFWGIRVIRGKRPEEGSALAFFARSTSPSTCPFGKLWVPNIVEGLRASDLGVKISE